MHLNARIFASRVKKVSKSIEFRIVIAHFSALINNNSSVVK